MCTQVQANSALAEPEIYIGCSKLVNICFKGIYRMNN